MSESTRAYVYRVSLALLALAVAVGWISGESIIAGVAGVIAAVTGNGLATLNTSRKADQ